MLQHTLESIPNGKPGLLVKVRRIRSMVEDAKRDPSFREHVAALLHDIPEKDQSAEIARLVTFTRSRVRYLRDPWSPTGLELFVEPRKMLADAEAGTAAGDCDDHVILASSLLETAGYPTRYVVGGLPPDDYRHIWLEVHHPKRGWLPCELTKKDWPVHRDPAGKFPFVERYDGGALRGKIMLGAHPSRLRIAVPWRAMQPDPIYEAMTPRQEILRDQASARAVRDMLRSRPRGGTSRVLAAQEAKARIAAARAGKAGFVLSDRKAMDPRQYAQALRDRTPRGGSTIARGWGERQAAIQRVRIQRMIERAERRARRTKGLHGLGDPIPPSFHNIPPRPALYAGATPSDFFRATDIRRMLPENSVNRFSPLLGFGLEDYLEDWTEAHALGFSFKSILRAPQQLAKGIGHTFSSIGKEAKRAVKRTKKEVGRTSKRVGKEVGRGALNYGPEAAGIAASIFGGPEAGMAIYGGLNALRQSYQAQKAFGRGEYPPEIQDTEFDTQGRPLPPPMNPTPQYPAVPLGPSIPASTMSPMPGPSFVEAAEGYALPPEVPDQVAIMDQGSGGEADMEGWEQPLPGAGRGSYIPEPAENVFPNAPGIDPFDTSSDATGESGGDVWPGFGEGYGTAPWLGYESQLDAAVAREEPNIVATGLADMDVLENTFGTLGAESWLTQLAQAAGQTALGYAQYRLQQQAAKKGASINFSPLTPPTPPPAPVIQQVPVPVTVPIVAPAAPPPPPMPARSGFSLSPAMLGVGALLLVLLAKK